MIHRTRHTVVAGLGLVTTLLAVTFYLTACDDAVAMDQSFDPAQPQATLLQDIGAPGGFTVEPLARGVFIDAINATFKIRMDGAIKRLGVDKDGEHRRRGHVHVVNVKDPSDIVVVKLTMQPGGSVGWHTHPGPAIATVQSGTLGIIMANDCKIREYPIGKAFVDPGQGNVHVGYNAGESPLVVYISLLDVPPGQPATIPAPDPGC